MMLASFAGTSWLRGPLLAELMPLVLTPVLLVGFRHRNSPLPMIRRAYAVVLGLVILAFGVLCVSRARRNVVDPPRWDVQSFWLFGHVAVAGYDFYLPESVHTVADSLRAAGEPVSDADDFTREVVDVGFPYPPPTMLMLAPLGTLGMHAAALLWYVIIVASVAAAIGLLWYLLFEPHGLWELAFTAAMVLTLRATYSTFAFGQTNFLLLLLLLLFWRNRERISGGVYLALAIVVKPIGAFFLAWTVLDRRWRSVLTTFLVLAGLAAATALMFGPHVFRSFITNNSTGRLPHSVYSSQVNQSLLATWVRATHYDFSHGSPLAQPAFLVTAFAIAGLTFSMV
ncbi:MAG: glycosyltransferase family 87 protein, partial [Gemmatimonadaceae bacterium]